MKIKLLLLFLVMNVHMNTVYAQSEAFFHKEIYKLDSICSCSDEKIQITNNNSRIFLCLMADIDKEFNYKLWFKLEKPLVIKRKRLEKIISHLKEEQNKLQNCIDSTIRKELNDSYEIKVLPNENNAMFHLASIHTLTPSFGYIDFKSLCEYYFNIIRCHSTNDDLYELNSFDVRCFVAVLDEIIKDERNYEKKWNPMYPRIHKTEFERLTTWCTGNYSNPKAWKVFYNVYSELALDPFLYYE